jgi:type II secretory pathway pseudopilin PulG
MRKSHGSTMPELLVAMTIMAIVVTAFAGLLKYSMVATTKAMNQGQAQEDVRRGLALAEEALVHANEVTVASTTFIEFICDIDQSPFYDPNGDLDGDLIPDFRDGDRDNDANLLAAATAQWQVGFNLKDDDEDGDGRVDVRRRLYLSGKSLLLDTSVNEEAWGARVKTLMTGVSTFTLTYFGSKANNLGKNIDLGNDGIAGTGDSGENDGIITAREMDFVQAPAGMGNRNGSLDLANERRYITETRIFIGVDRNRDGNNDYTVETDVYPPLLPVKSR